MGCFRQHSNQLFRLLSQPMDVQWRQVRPGWYQRLVIFRKGYSHCHCDEFVCWDGLLNPQIYTHKLIMILHFSTMVPICSYHALSKITNLSWDIYNSKTNNVCTPWNLHFFSLKIYRAPTGNGITQSFSSGIDLKRGVGWRISTTRKNFYLVASIPTNQVHRVDMIEFCGLVGGEERNLGIFLSAIVIFQVGCERYIKIKDSHLLSKWNYRICAIDISGNGPLPMLVWTCIVYSQTIHVS